MVFFFAKSVQKVPVLAKSVRIFGKSGVISAQKLRSAHVLSSFSAKTVHDFKIFRLVLGFLEK